MLNLLSIILINNIGISLQKEIKRDDNGHRFLKDVGLIFSGISSYMLIV